MVAINNLSRWLWGEKHQESKIINPSIYSSKSDADTRVKRKCQSKKECENDKRNVVLESDGSDWSIGWLEPHGVGFLTHDDSSDDSFVVLVHCNGNEHNVAQKNPCGKLT